MKKKLIYFAIVIGIIGILTGYDYIRSTQIDITVKTVNPSVVYASSSETVEITLEVKDKKGNRIEGHNIYALSVGGGSFRTFYEKTDKNGNVTFVYYPPDLAGYQEKVAATLKFRDESNSVFIEFYPKTELQLEMKRPDSNDGQGMTSDGYLD